MNKFALIGVCGLAAPAMAGVGGGGMLTLLSRYETGVFEESAAEIVAHDPATQRLFITNGATGRIDVLSIADPTTPQLLFSIDLSAYGASANSVAVSDGIIAIAVEANVKTDPGTVVFTDASGVVIDTAPVGALPDMLIFTPDGLHVLVANEGEPNDDYTIDPEGSISVVRVPRNGVTALSRTAGFASFNAGVDPAVRIFGPGATVAQDLEPEYIAVSADSTTAWAVCQENNALAVIDIASAQVTAVLALGFKDHMLANNVLDASDRDQGINFANWPVLGMYQPDAIVAFETGGQTYLISANEGDARDYAGFSEETRVRSVVLDPTAFPNAATLRQDANIGRLRMTSATGDTDGDGDFDQIYAFGGRSISVWTAAGSLLWDSGAELEALTAVALPQHFNSTNNANGSFDSRSDDKGPEPEGLAVATLGGVPYAFVGLERIGGIVVYDLSDPSAPSYIEYVNTRDFAGDPVAGTAGDLAPEGLTVIPAEDSPNGRPLLVVAYEVSGSTAIFEINAPSNCPADFFPDGRADFFDVSEFLSLFNAQDPRADLAAPAGSFDFFDIDAFLTLFGAGCP